MSVYTKISALVISDLLNLEWFWSWSVFSGKYNFTMATYYFYNQIKEQWWECRDSAYSLDLGPEHQSWKVSSSLPLSWALTFGCQGGLLHPVVGSWQPLLPMCPASEDLSWTSCLWGTCDEWNLLGLGPEMQEGVFPLRAVGGIGFLCFSSK